MKDWAITISVHVFNIKEARCLKNWIWENKSQQNRTHRYWSWTSNIVVGYSGVGSVRFVDLDSRGSELVPPACLRYCVLLSDTSIGHIDIIMSNVISYFSQFRTVYV